MQDEILKRDQNSAVVLGGVTDDAYQLIRMLRVDPITGRLLISATGGGGGGGLNILTFPDAVDGSNQSFTASGTVQLAILDGGRTLQKVSSSGVTNWSGTSSITFLTDTPNFDLILMG